MTAAEKIVDVSTWVGLVFLVAAFLLTTWRVVKGPTLPDRVVALDMLVGIVIGFIALIAIRTGFTLYVDIAIALGLVGFLATVAFARFILSSANTRTGAEGALEAPPASDTDATVTPAKAKPAKPEKAAKPSKPAKSAKPASTATPDTAISEPPAKPAAAATPEATRKARSKPKPKSKPNISPEAETRSAPKSGPKPGLKSGLKSGKPERGA
jgi:multisubunit Na+/H+ antiporter MnhF subunit